MDKKHGYMIFKSSIVLFFILSVTYSIGRIFCIMAIPGFQAIMLPLLKTVNDGQEHEIKETITTLSNLLHLTDIEKLVRVKSGQQLLFDNRVSWAKTYLNKAGLLQSTRRGFFHITTMGTEVANNGLESINIKYLRMLIETKNQSSSINKTNNPSGTEENTNKQLAYEHSHQKMSALLEKAKAYGFTNPVTLTIISLLCEVRAQSRKIQVVLEKAKGKVGSEKIVKRRINELLEIGFLIKKNNLNENLKIPSYIIKRNINEIIFEHNLILEKIKNHQRYKNLNRLSREIRKLVIAEFTNNVSSRAVNVHVEVVFRKINPERTSKLPKQKDDTAEGITPDTDLNEGTNNNGDSEYPEMEKDIIDDPTIDIEDLFPPANPSGKPDDGDVIPDDVFKPKPTDPIQDSNSPKRSMIDDNPINPTNSISITEQILNYFKNIRNCKISENFRQIFLSININDNHIALKIDIDDYHDYLIVTSFLPFNEDYLIEMLRLFSNNEMIGNVAIDRTHGDDFVIIKKVVVMKKYNTYEIIKIIEKIISETDTVMEKIIKTYA
jgi:hypothetical protein